MANLEHVIQKCGSASKAMNRLYLCQYEMYYNLVTALYIIYWLEYCYIFCLFCSINVNIFLFIENMTKLVVDLQVCDEDVQETWTRLIATHNEGSDITTLLAQYTKKIGDKDALIAAIVTAYEAEITKLKDGDFAGQLSGEQKAKIKTEMRLLEDICDQNIRECSILESEESINLELFHQILNGVSEKCPLVYEMMESLVISNPRSRNILKSNMHKILCGLQTLGFMSNIQNSKLFSFNVWPSLHLIWSWTKVH